MKMTDKAEKTGPRNPGLEETKWCRDEVSAVLRDRLERLLDRNAETIPPEVLDDLRQWAATDASPEGLAEWLEGGGWETVEIATGDKVETRLVKAARSAMAGIEIHEKDEEKTVARMSVHMPSKTKSSFSVLWYEAARNDKREIAFDIECLPKNPPVLRGLDALKYGLHWHDWPGLARCLPDPTDPAEDWLTLLAAPWLDERRAGRVERLDARARALPLALQSRNLIKAKQTTGAAFLRFPSALRDAGAWAAALVPVDGDTIFAEEPNLAAVPLRVEGGESLQLHKPKAWTIAKGHLINAPLQMVLPGLTLNPKQNRDLGAFLAVSATGAAVLEHLDGTCAKLIPLLFGLCPLDGTPVRGPVKDLVKLLYPDWKARRQMAGDVARVAAAAAAVRDLRAVEVQRDGRLRVYPLLAGGYYDIPTNAEQEPEACFSLNPELGRLAAPAKGAGFMLVNLSGLMRLPANSPERIAVALILAAYWHTCKQRTNAGRLFMPERLDFLPVDDLLVTSNVSGRVAGGIDGTDKSRTTKVRLSEARARMVEETLPALVTAGLVGKLDVKRPGRHGGRAGKAWIVKVDPPADYLEASRKTGRARRKPTAAGRAAPRKGG